ncbi:hypothetical protein GLOTRDRAFT_33335 [Gloeophyllum trabeum ATCC 11539]|uniref:BTB domain-containing protein n=1 Tax=Gloeophyllum trabeum (strain ATCC 11539 / FP-39264 / Madison 617) TaxID=670483 RepID=S7RVG6_GLOTA|nr:uncharacterized protein GLOTRDRAFT_33335 [Gloeophyllum trabeum ATCC 11539]EPQ58790.1 hypothetical protein GLOTRDRAFT_33335 [Gloeophyllum trabeum ATCC 11539]
MEISTADYIRSDLWFSDGNTMIVAGRALFKVHRGQLERHSEVFRDMFALPQPPCQETIEGCLPVVLYDSPSDVLFLLRALYDGLYFKTAIAHDFQVISAVLRLSSKYLIGHLRRHCISRLEVDWPSSLLGWDHREKMATDPSTGRYNPREMYAHPILVISLATELGLDHLLPAAYYDLCRYGPSKIASGVPPSNPDSPILLSRRELLSTFLGREAGQRYIITFIQDELAHRPPARDCSASPISGNHPCLESFYFIQLNILRSVGGIAAGRDGDPLYTLAQAVEMLSRTDFSDGVNQCGLKICNACRAEFMVSVRKCRERVWSEVPGWFGLIREERVRSLEI